jgi:hypothetical protein
MGESVIAVPIHLDALYVKGPSAVVPAMADFTRLPFFDGERDVNAQAAWLGETAANEAFAGSTLNLKKGIHLHWRFPRGLTTGMQTSGGKMVFPNLPDRWFVTRGRETGGAQVVEDQWVIESSYVYPEGISTDGAAYPIESLTTGRCYRAVGRALPLEQWLKRDRQGAAYLDSPLTAIGYGEPTFASFYPNCSQQFGFHDPHYAEQIPDGLYYMVIGWYSEQKNDWLQVLMKQSLEQPSREGWQSRLAKILKERLGWSIQGSPTRDVVIVCRGSLVFRPKTDLLWEPQLKHPEVTFGATITEALSAYLASKVAPGDLKKKELIEDQLEAIMLDRTLSTRSIDLTAKFKEARHEKGFDEVYSGILWTVRSEPLPGEEPDQKADAAAWPDVAEGLETLNRLQSAYHIAWDEIHSLRRRLYSDWCRYMRASYPKPGAASYPTVAEVRLLIEQQLAEIDRKIADVGLLDLSRRDPEAAPPYSETKPDSLARKIARAFESILVNLRAHDRENAGKTVIQPAVAPRYWRPTEPVILLTGEAVRLDEPFHVEDMDGDGLLVCELKAPYADIERRFRISPSSFLAHFSSKPRTWSEQPWHPLLLQWEVELTPFLRLANLTTPDRNYDAKFLTRNFVLKISDADLSPRTAAGELDGGQSYQPAADAFVYKGSSLLTPHVADQFLSHLYRFLERMADEEPEGGDSPFVLTDGTRDGPPPGSRETIEFLIGRLKKDPPNGLGASTIEQLGDVLEHLQKQDVFCLAQRLSGFNEALLVHQQTLRIPIRNPIGFAEDRGLAARVASAVGSDAQQAPQPGKAFCPIRTGELRVKHLRLVSTFGRQLDFASSSVITATPMQAPSRPGAAVFLPPRLVQPARLQFRWLAAASEQQEMNAHPDSSPICGWVIANYLDNNLFFYSGSGEALGSLEVEANARVRWRPTPGAAEPVTRLEQIENESLRKMVAFFLGGIPIFLSQFLNDLKAAQERIEPENCGDPMPMGQPLALVRASLNLELQGLPAIHRTWMEAGESRTLRGADGDRFTGVRFPIRLGEQEQLNDGLAVYWVENEDGSYKDDAYVIPSYDDDPASQQDKKCDFLYQSIDDAPLKVAMLIDPRGVVHAATGILPAKAIHIPAYQYSSAMKQFEMTFLNAPVLTGRRVLTGEDNIALPVADLPGYRWSWIEKRGEEWTSPAIQAADLFRPFAGATEIREGWLKLELRKDEVGK